MEDKQAKKKIYVDEEESEDKVKWVKHYSSNHSILLVGEGDFSFSSSLAHSFGSASNIIATSLDSYGDVVKRYKKAKSNMENLSELGASIIHGVDATKMKLHRNLKMQKFDRIIFNFPHAGFHGKEDNVDVIERHKNLVLGFFKNASDMLLAYGEIHVSHKTSRPFCLWNIEELAWRNSLALMERVDFKIEDYPGYNNKRGDGNRCDEPFRLGECCTFKFIFYPAIKMSMNNLNLFHKRFKLYQDNPIQMQCQPSLSYYRDPCQPSLSYYRDPRPSFFTNRSDFLGNRPSPLALCAERANLLDRHYNHASEIYERAITRDVDHFYSGAQRHDYERCMAETFGRFQQFQGNPIKIQHQPASVGVMDPQTSFNINMNQHPGYIGEPLKICIGKETVNASHGFSNRDFKEPRKSRMLFYDQHSEETRMSDLELSAAGAPRRILNDGLNVLDKMNIRRAMQLEMVSLYGQHEP